MMAYLLSEPAKDLVELIPAAFDSYFGVLAEVRSGKAMAGVTYGNPDKDLPEFRNWVLGQLVKDGHANVGDDGRYVLTKEGAKYVADLLDD